MGRLASYAVTSLVYLWALVVAMVVLGSLISGALVRALITLIIAVAPVVWLERRRRRRGTTVTGRAQVEDADRSAARPVESSGPERRTEVRTDRPDTKPKGLRGPALFAGGSLLLLAVVVGLTIALASSDSNEGGDDSATPAVTTTATEPIATERAAPQPTIPGLVAVDVYGNFEKRGFDCTGPKRLKTTSQWLCKSADPGGSAEYIVDIMGRTPVHIESIEGNAFIYDGRIDRAAAFLGFLATLPFDGAQPARARSFVESNIAGGEATTTFGQVRFRLYGTKQAKFLEIHHVEYPR